MKLIDADAAKTMFDPSDEGVLYAKSDIVRRLNAAQTVCCEECNLLREPRAEWCAECYCGDSFERREP